MNRRAPSIACVVLLACAAATACGESETTSDRTRAAEPSSTPAATPRAMTTVPAFDLGTSVDDVVRLLEGAGLTATVPEANFPHYAVMTDPPAGTEVPVGSRIEILIGDG